MATQNLGKKASRPTDTVTRCETMPLTGVLSVSAASTILASAYGNYVYLYGGTLNGSYAVTLPAASNGSAGSPFVLHFEKADGLGCVVLTAASGDTFETGLTTAFIYQESVTIVATGGGSWSFINRKKGWISIAKQTALTSTTSLALTTAAFTDKELSEIEINFDSFSTTTSAQLVAQVTKGGSLQTTGYYTSLTYSSSTSAQTTIGSTTSAQCVLTAPASTANCSGKLSVRAPWSTQAGLLKWESMSLIGGYGAMIGKGFSTANGAITAVTIAATAGATFAGGLYDIRGFRT